MSQCPNSLDRFRHAQRRDFEMCRIAVPMCWSDKSDNMRICIVCSSPNLNLQTDYNLTWRYSQSTPSGSSSCYRCAIARCRLRLSAFPVTSWLLVGVVEDCCVWQPSSSLLDGLPERTRKRLAGLSTIKSIRLIGLNPCYSLRRFPDGLVGGSV